MAHKGRVYPYFYARDLSLKPGGYTYLPDKWSWSGILATGGAGNYFVGKTFTLDAANYVNPYDGLVYWYFEDVITPFDKYLLEIYYQITHQPNMATLEFWFRTPGGVTSRIFPKDVTQAFPYNQLSGPVQNHIPTALNVQYPGVLVPKGW